MGRNQKRSRLYIALLFVIPILYLIGSLFYSFNYLDFGYLVIVVVGFVKYIRIIVLG